MEPILKISEEAPEATMPSESQRVEPNIDRPNIHFSVCLNCSFILQSTWIGVSKASIVRRQ